MKSHDRTGRRSEQSSSPFRALHENRRLIGLSYRRLTLVCLLSVVTGLGQAAILIILVRVATALTADTVAISGSIGPITALDLTVGQLILMGAGVVLLLFVAEFATSWAEASLFANSYRTAQQAMLAAYSGARFDVQTELQRGDTNQVLLVHTGNAAGLVSSIGAGAISIVNFATLILAALIVSPIAALVVLAGLIAMLAALRPLILLSRRLGGNRASAQRRMGALAAERLELTREIKAFGVDGLVDRSLRRQVDLVARLVERLRLVSRMASASYRVGAYGIILIMMALIDASNASNLAALTGSLLMLLRSLSYGQAAQAMYQQLSENVPIVEQLGSEHGRLCAGVEDSDGRRSVAKIGDLALERVSFAYPAGEPVLHDVSIQLDQGDFVALVGPSGAGKSTLMHILLRLRNPTAGAILADGIPAAELGLSYWRRKVAYVPQDPKLLSGTVSESIRFHRENITHDDVIVAARRAHIDQEIESWSDGYDTDVGQLGENVSGGQRQRIALARALVGNPDVLLLDEPTSALDPVSERLIGETLEELQGEMTIVVIAHRPATVKRANRVILMRDGRVVPHGADDLTALADFMGNQN